MRWSKYSLLLISSGNFFGLQIYHLICSFDCHPTAWSILRMVAEALIGAYVVALTIWYCSNRKVNHHKSLTNHLTTISAILLYWYLAATGQYLSITYHTNIHGSNMPHLLSRSFRQL